MNFTRDYRDQLYDGRLRGRLRDRLTSQPHVLLDGQIYWRLYTRFRSLSGVL
jgi:hypothetical protein